MKMTTRKMTLPNGTLTALRITGALHERHALMRWKSSAAASSSAAAAASSSFAIPTTKTTTKTTTSATATHQPSLMENVKSSLWSYAKENWQPWEEKAEMEASVKRLGEEIRALKMERTNLLTSLDYHAKRERATNASLSGEVEKSQNLARLLEKTKAELAARRVEPLHPLYGELLLDLGTKKIYAASARRVVNKELFPIWSKQRLFRPERAERIAQNIKKEGDRFGGFPGCVTLFQLEGEAAAETRGNEVRGIVDGQHRIAAIEILLNQGVWPESRPVLVEVYPVSTAREAASLFHLINKAEPVQEMDYPSLASAPEEISEAEAAANFKAAVDSVTARIEKLHPRIFRPSARCKPPHLHADTFRQALFDCAEARKAFAKKGEEADLLNFVLRRNERVRAKLEKAVAASASGGEESMAPSRLEAFEKAKEHGLFLGMDKTWCE